MNLKDSGNRREFTSGAVRDIAEGKGRCDLLPLDIVGDILKDSILLYINHYLIDGNKSFLLKAIDEFIVTSYPDYSTAMLELAKHYEDGAKKYSENNWQKGIPSHCYIDSGVRHYLKFRRGDMDEPHGRAFLWNLFGALWTHQHKPEFIDLPFIDKGVCNQ